MKNKADAVVAVSVPFGVFEILGRTAVDDQISAVVMVQPADDVQAGGFARAAGAENGDKLRLAKAEADVIERNLGEIAGGIAFGDVF